MSMLIRWSLNRLGEVIPTLWDDFSTSWGFFPPDASPDWKVLRRTILAEYGNMGIAFPVPAMQGVMGDWVKRNEYMILGLWESTQQKYSMIENFDRYEEYSTNTDDNGHNSSTGSAEASGTSSQTTANKAANYDSAKMVDTDTSSGTGSGSNKSSATNEVTLTNKRTEKHTGHLHGNIGVTTSAQMLEAERRLHEYDVYKDLADRFCKDLLVGIYIF